MTKNNENINENSNVYDINELDLYETVIRELMKCEEITLVRKIMRINPELSTRINSKSLNKEFKDIIYKFTMINGTMKLIKNTYKLVKDKLNDNENELINRIKNKALRDEDIVHIMNHKDP